MIRSGLYTKNQMSILLERLASRTQIMDLGIIEFFVHPFLPNVVRPNCNVKI